ncbi:MAG: peptidoglycan-binding protein [Clostridiales bacterium]|nr:peptidoglycan-binding protein [Clostridiales bacterium]
MKRILSVLLALCLLVPMAASAEVIGRLNQEIATRTGPGTHYTEPGAFLGRGAEVRVISKVYDANVDIWWVQVEFRDGYDMIRAYTGSWRMNVNLDYVPEERRLEDCYLTQDADAFAGPGINYLLWNDTVHSGTKATLYAVENGYGQIECWNMHKQDTWRVWVDLDCLSCGSKYAGVGSSLYQPGMPEYYKYLPAVPYGGITPTCGNRNSIMWVQQCLRSLGYGKLAVDGNWGNQTASAVREFKLDYGFGSDGYQVSYDAVCKMLDMFYKRDLPLRYLEHYLPE